MHVSIKTKRKRGNLQENIVERANLRTDLLTDGCDIALQVRVGGRRRVHQERELHSTVRNDLGLRFQVRHNGFQGRIFFPRHSHQSHISSSICTCFHDGVDVLHGRLQRLLQLFHGFSTSTEFSQLRPRLLTQGDAFKSDATHNYRIQTKTKGSFTTRLVRPAAAVFGSTWEEKTLNRGKTTAPAGAFLWAYFKPQELSFIQEESLSIVLH